MNQENDDAFMRSLGLKPSAHATQPAVRGGGPGFLRAFGLPLVGFAYQVLVHGSVGRGLIVGAMIFVLTYGGHVWDA